MSSGEEKSMKPNPNRGLLLGIFIAIIMLFAFMFVGDGLSMLQRKPKQFSEILLKVTL